MLVYGNTTIRTITIVLLDHYSRSQSHLNKSTETMLGSGNCDGSWMTSRKWLTQSGHAGCRRDCHSPWAAPWRFHASSCYSQFKSYEWFISRIFHSFIYLGIFPPWQTVGKWNHNERSWIKRSCYVAWKKKWWEATTLREALENQADKITI